MNVSRREILSRGLHLRCPNCGAKSLFFPRSLRIHEKCPECGLELNRGEGFFLGPMVINYSIAVFGFVVPCILLWVRGVLSDVWAAGLAIAACTALPVALYRYSWSLWLMVYFYVLPDRLPANSVIHGIDTDGGD